MAKGDDIQDRLIKLAVSLNRICERLPDTVACGNISSQLIRSGNSPAPNYAEARGAESDKDFVHKLGVVLKELNESLVWLRMIEEGAYLTPDELAPIKEECTSMCRIIAASINTVRRRCGSDLGRR